MNQTILSMSLLAIIIIIISVLWLSTTLKEGRKAVNENHHEE
tara:strand:+ start:948 stop:1073 length:126 start_codon:yes stop_codon:yes gene_type:complete